VDMPAPVRATIFSEATISFAALLISSSVYNSLRSFNTNWDLPNIIIYPFLKI